MHPPAYTTKQELTNTINPPLTYMRGGFLFADNSLLKIHKI